MLNCFSCFWILNLRLDALTRIHGTGFWKVRGSLPCQYSRRWQNMTKFDITYNILQHLTTWNSGIPVDVRFVHGIAAVHWSPRKNHTHCCYHKGGALWSWVSQDFEILAGWWFGTFFIFPNSWDDDPIWLIFFRGVETTNQLALERH